MFSKSKKEPGNKPAVQVSRKSAAPSIIGADLRIVGDLKSEGEIQVDGFIDGDIRTKVLLIGESATVKGEVVGDTVRVYGKVNGQIKARAVTLAKSAHVVGNILHENLSIEEGAFLEGHCKRMREGEFQGEGKINLVSSASGVSPKDDSKSTAPSKGDDAKKLVTGL
jgi:cytoskeletal protein CcmA (bactofilin family)